MLSFKEYLLENDAHAQYATINDVINTAPIVLVPILNSIQKISNNLIKLKNSNLFNPYNGKKTSATVFKTSLDNIKLLAKYFNEDVIMVDSSHEGFYHIEDKYLFKFIKTGSLALTIGATKTIYQELGTLLYIDNDLKPLDDYKPSPRLKIKNESQIQETIEFLNNNSSWNESCLEQARAIIKTFKNYKKYELHHGSDSFKLIKTIGKRLSKLSEDKWNPSDIFLIKDSQKVEKIIKEINNILEYNNYISQFDDVIGISLKKSQNDAVHGAVALDKIIEMKNLGMKTQVINNLESIKENLIIQLNQLKTSPLAKYVFLSKFNSLNIKENILNIKPESKNFTKSLPLGVEFLTRISSNINLALETIKLAYIVAASKHPLSCSHYKVECSKVSLIDKHNAFDFKLNKIIIPVNGDTNVIFVITINNEIIKLQLRSKGTKPQFIVIKQNADKNNKNIRDFN